MGSPALRAALVSIEISALTFFWKISESNAFCAPAAPEPAVALSEAIQDTGKIVALSAGQALDLAHRRATDLQSYRLGRVAEWCQPRYQLDERFVVVLMEGHGAYPVDSQATGTIYDDDGAGSSDSIGAVSHGADIHTQLAPPDAVTPDVDVFFLREDVYASYEMVVDAASGDVQPLAVELLGTSGTSTIPSVPVGAGPARSIRWIHDSSTSAYSVAVRVSSGGCGVLVGVGVPVSEASAEGVPVALGVAVGVLDAWSDEPSDPPKARTAVRAAGMHWRERIFPSLINGAAGRQAQRS